MARRRFSLFELSVALLVLAAGVFGALFVLGGSAQLRVVSAETETAARVLRAQLASLRSLSTDLGLVAQQEGTFEVTSPRLKAGSGVIRVLTEAQASAAFRTDLNRDGTVDANDAFDLDGDGVPGEGELGVPGDTSTGSLKSAYATLVPVELVIGWKSAAGKTRTMTARSFIYPSQQ